MRKASHRWMRLLFLLGACTPEVNRVPATQVVVRIDADLDTRAALEALRVRTAGEQDGQWAPRDATTLARSNLKWPVDIVITPRAESEAGAYFEVIVDALGSDARVLVQTRALTSFVLRKARVLMLQLARCGEEPLGFVCEEEACFGPECQTCVNAQCQNTPIVRPEELLPLEEPTLADGDSEAVPPPEGGSRDAGLDADVEFDARTDGGGDRHSSPAGDPPALVEPITDPNDGSKYSVDFNFTLTNESPNTLNVAAMRFEFRRGPTTLKTQRVYANQIPALVNGVAESPATWTHQAHARILTPNWEDFLTRWGNFGEASLQMRDFETFVDAAGTRWFMGLLEEGPPGGGAWIGATWDGFSSKRQEFEDLGLRLIDIETYVEGGTRLWAGIFRSGSYAPRAAFFHPYSEFVQHLREAEADGYRLQDIETFVEAGQRLYAGVFEPGNEAAGVWINANWPSFHEFWEGQQGAAIPLQDLEVYLEGSELKYTGIFREGSPYTGSVMGFALPDFESRWIALDADNQHMFEAETYVDESGMLRSSGLYRPADAFNWAPGAELRFVSPHVTFGDTVPDSVRIHIDLADGTSTRSLTVPLSKANIASDSFIGRQDDLGPDEFWFQGGNGHQGPRVAGMDVLPGAAHRLAEGEAYAYDLGVARWDSAESIWKMCSGDCIQNSDYHVWGVPVRATEDGQVVDCADGVADNLPNVKGRGSGNFVVVAGASGVVTYAHLRRNSVPFTCPVTDPQVVAAGDQIGLAGNSGASDFPHLHLHRLSHSGGHPVPILFKDIDVWPLSNVHKATWTPVASGGSGLAHNVLIRPR